MIEWDVLDDEPIPHDSTEEQRERPPRKPLPWKWIALVSIIAIAVTSGGIAWRYRVAQQELRNDIEQVVLREERAVRLGVGDQASTFADPDASIGWKAWYGSTYTTSELPLPAPVIETIEQGDSSVLVTLRYDIEGHVWRNVRSYRLVNDQWRRSPIPVALWQRTDSEEAEFFTLEMSEEEAAVVPPDALAQTLTTFREAWRDGWPLDNNQPLTITFSADETLTEPQFTNQRITIRSPLLNPIPNFDPPTACSLGLITALAQLYSGELNATGEEEYLRITMRQAMVKDIIENTDGLCQVVDSAQLPRDVLGLPPAFADYLVYAGGRNAAKGFLDVYDATGNPVYALLQASPMMTNDNYEIFSYAAERMSVEGRPLPITTGVLQEEGIAYGTVSSEFYPATESLSLRGLTGLITTLSLSSYFGSTTNAPSPECLTEGTAVAFTYAQANQITDIRVLSRPLDPIAVPVLPPTTQLIYHHTVGDTTMVYARTTEGETVELLQMPAGTSISINPVGTEFAFLTRDECGWVMNEYDGQSSVLRRWALPNLTPQRLLWVLNTPMAVVQTEDADGNPYWQLYTGIAETISGNTQVALIAANVGTLLGFRPIPHSYLVYEDNALQWTLPAIEPGDTALVGLIGRLEPIPFRFTPNTEFSALSVDGRWLTYTVYPSDGRSDLNVIDLLDQEHRYLATIPPSSAGGQSQWATQVVPTYSVIVGSLGETRDSGMSILRYTLPSDSGEITTDVYRAVGEIDNLQWCRNGQILTFRETTTDGARIMQWDGEQTAPLTDFDEADRVLWCP